MMNEDITLIQNIKNDKDVEESLKELTCRHSGVFYDRVLSFVNHPNFGTVSGVTKEDIYTNKDYIIYSAAISFNETLGVKFSTWLGNSTFYFLHHLYHKNKNETLVDNFPENNSFEEESIEYKLFCNKEIIDKIKSYIENLKDKRIQKLFELRYWKPTNGKLTSWKVIGKELNLSHEGCRLLHNKTIEDIKVLFIKES